MRLIINFLVVMFLSAASIFGDDGFPDAYNSTLHTFTMLGDSRTHFIKIHVTPHPDGTLAAWHDKAFLGAYSNKKVGDPKSKIQNIAIGGTTAAQWEALCLANASPCKANEMAKRVVVMIGGNDVKDSVDEWRKIPWGYSRDVRKKQALNKIHAKVKNIVTALVARGKEVIVQGHFKVNPSYVLNVFSDKHLADNEGLMGLRQRLEDDFHPHLVIVDPGHWKITGWKSVCGTVGWCPFCFRGCVPIAIVDWEPPVVSIKGVFLNTSYAFLPTDFPVKQFQDDIHLNTAGYVRHSSHLINELRGRGWW